MTNQELTEKDIAMCDCIQLYIKKNGFSPSVRELGTMMGLKSTSTVHNRLMKLEKCGKIRKVAESPRTIVMI